jgi:hypothetical protein
LSTYLYSTYHHISDIRSRFLRRLTIESIILGSLYDRDDMIVSLHLPDSCRESI